MSEECYECGATIGTSWSKSYDGICKDCLILKTNPNEGNHEEIIRCPSCGYLNAVSWGDDPHLQQEGEHEYSCMECGHDFIVSTSVSITIHSPPMIEGKFPVENKIDDTDD